MKYCLGAVDVSLFSLLQYFVVSRRHRTTENKAVGIGNPSFFSASGLFIVSLIVSALNEKRGVISDEREKQLSNLFQ